MKLLPSFALVLFIFCLAPRGKGQDVFGTGARNQSLGDASSALSGAWSVFGNQAGLAGVQRPVLAGAFQNRFLVSELSSRAGIFALPVQTSVFAFSFSQFGRIPFRHEKLALAYAKAVTSHIRLGFQFNRYGLYLAEENQSANSYGLEIGVQYIVSGNFILGAHWVNPYRTGVKLSSELYRYPSKISAGMFYQVSPDFAWVTEMENAFDEHLKLKTGFEYDIRKRLAIRAGISGKPYQLSAGFGFRANKIAIDFAASYNQYLGNSPSISCQYQF